MNKIWNNIQTFNNARKLALEMVTVFGIWPFSEWKVKDPSDWGMGFNPRLTNVPLTILGTLAMMASQSQQENIATELYRSPHTVKPHMLINLFHLPD